MRSFGGKEHKEGTKVRPGVKQVGSDERIKLKKIRTETKRPEWLAFTRRHQKRERPKA